MSEIQKLLRKKENLLLEISLIKLDLVEYINNPVETVSVDQMHYQYNFIIKDIHKIDRIIYEELKKPSLSLHSTGLELKKLTDKATSEILFTVNDLPKLHFTMFEDLNPINE